MPISFNPLVKKGFDETGGEKGDPGATGAGVVIGGTTGQILAKKTNTDYDTEWVDPSSSYTLPTASASVLGGVKVGTRLTITDGVLSADVQTTDISGKEDVGVAAGLITSHETTYDHTLIATALQEETDPIYSANSYAVSMDQGVATTNTPQFLRLGLGQAASSTKELAVLGNAGINNTFAADGVLTNDRVLELTGTVSSDSASGNRYPRALFAQIDTAGTTNFGASSEVLGLQGQARHYNADISVMNIGGLLGRAGGWNNAVSTVAYGLRGMIQGSPFGGGTGTASWSPATAIVVDSQLVLGGGTFTSTDAYLFRGYVSKATGGTSAISNMYGLYLPAITYGTSKNYAIYSAGGDSYFAGGMSAASFSVGATAGIDATVALAKLTTGGANGSLTVTKGIITAYTAPT